MGSTTIEREDLNCAVEADTCFYFHNEAMVRGKSIDFKIHPPPDLIVECDYMNSSLDQLDIYECLGIPEVWRYRRQKLTVYKLVEGKYQQSDSSLAFPWLAIAQIPEYIDRSYTLGNRAAVKLFKQYVRNTIGRKDL